MPNPYGEFVPDPTMPSGFRWKSHDEPEPTQIQPAVADDQHADFSPVDPNQLPLFDFVDSTTIVDYGAP